MNERANWLQREQRWMYVTAILLFLLSLVFAGREYFLDHIDRNWETLRTEVDEGQADIILRRLASLLRELEKQSDLLRFVRPDALLTASDDSRTRAEHVRRMMQAAPPSLWAFELRDRGWSARCIQRRTADDHGPPR